MSHPHLEIRPLAETDSLVELTALLHRAYARLGNMGLNYTAVDQSVEKTEGQVRDGACFVAVAGRELVGTISVRLPKPYPECSWYGEPHVAVANRFAVNPELQGQGIGSRLLLRAESWAREMNFTELALDTAEQATHLIAFYTRREYRWICTLQWPGKVYRSVILSKTIGPVPPTAR
jgi:GNAT superfamily N-acetyltransferase